MTDYHTRKAQRAETYRLASDPVLEVYDWRTRLKKQRQIREVKLRQYLNPDRLETT